MRLRLPLALLAAAVSLSAQPTLPRTPADAERLEAQVQSSPEDIPARLMLLRYYLSPAGTVPIDRVKTALRTHAVWMIEHHPEHASLRDPWAAISPEGKRTSDAEAYAAADLLWRKHLAADSHSAAVYANAIHFYQLYEPEFAHKIASDGMRTYPQDATLAQSAGIAAGLAILHAKSEDQYGRVVTFDDSEAAFDRDTRARAELEKEPQASFMGGAGGIMQQQISALDMARRTDRVAEMDRLAESYLKRAIQMDPRNPRWGVGLSQVYTLRASRTQDVAEKIELLRKSVAASDELNRLSPLESLANAYVRANDYPKAADTARDLLTLAAKFPENWAYGNAIHHGNIVLGQVALRQGNTAEAVKRLLVAGGTKGSPQLNSFGPDWSLAGQLIAYGEKEAVLEYIDLCRKFWASGTSRMDSWSATIRSGGVPNFSPRPELGKPDLAGRPAPAFALPRLKGGEVSLEQYRGKIVLLDFWATWCKPCREEMPFFEKMHREFAGGDAVILAVDVGEADDVVAEYIDKEKYTFPVLLAERSPMVTAYGVNAYPTLVSIDRQGKVVEYLIGGRDEATLRTVVARARGGAPAPTAPPPQSPASVQTTPATSSRQLPPPRQISPPPDSVFDHFPRSTTVVWAEVPGASAYVVEWDYRDSAGWNVDRTNGALSTMRVTEPVAVFNFVGAQPGRWRVYALDAAGNSGQPSPWREFRYTH